MPVRQGVAYALLHEINVHLPLALNVGEPI